MVILFAMVSLSFKLYSDMLFCAGVTEGLVSNGSDWKSGYRRDQPLSLLQYMSNQDLLVLNHQVK